MGFKYLGPAHNLQLEDGGKVYHPGDEVPISLASAVKMNSTMNGGHQFVGLMEALEKATNPQEEVTPPHDILEDVQQAEAPKSSRK